MLVRLLDMKLHEPFCPSLLLPPMRTQPVVFTAVGSPFYPWQKSLWSNKSLWSVHINNVTSESFSTGKSMSFRWECIFFISETLYRLNGIFKLCSTQADICVEPDIDVELISNDTVPESILYDLDRALVTISFSCFPSRFNLCAVSFLKVVSEPQSNKALVSIKHVHLIVLQK